MKYYIQQLSNKDCGITALKILLANIYKRKDFLFYPEANLNESLSLEQLITIAKNEGVELKGYRIKNKEEIKLLKNKKILVILIRNGISHIVNVDKIGTKYIKVYDSSLGFIKYKYEDFYKLFSGEFLEVISVKGSNYKHKDKTLMPLKYKLVILGLQLISFLLLAVTFFFVNEEFSFIVPLILVFSFSLLFVIQQQFLVYAMKKVDKTLFYEIFNRSKDKIKEKYLNITKLKKSLFVDPSQLIASILMVLIAIIILGLNSYLNLISIGIVLIAQIVLLFVQNRFFNTNINKISSLENSFFASKNKEDSYAIYEKLNSATYKYINIVNLKKCVIYLLIIVLCFFISSLTGNISLNFILFHFFIFILISENLEKIMLYKSQIEEQNYLKSYYYYYSKY